VLFVGARTSVALRAFLHRLTGAFLLLHLIRFVSGTVFRFGSPVSSSLLVGALDDLGLLPRLFLFLSTLLLALFFFATAERSLVAFRIGEREFPVLILLLHIGGTFALYLSTTRELFLALERVTLASYVLIAFERQNRFSTFAGLHYFLLGAIPSGILLLAFAFFYLFGGSLVIQERDLLFVPAAAVAFPAAIHGFSVSSFSTQSSVFAESAFLADVLNANTFGSGATSLIFDEILSVTNPLVGVTTRAVVFLIVNFFFKLTAAPVHFWAPTVYGYGPLPAVTILSIYGKARVLFLLVKLSLTFLHAFSGVLTILVGIAGVRSVLAGRLGAFPETALKRFFVFSSRGHVGYRLLAFGIQDAAGLTASLQYLFVYSLSALLGWSFLLTRGRSA
jgi:NADH-quinone oxidoreductase subunit N